MHARSSCATFSNISNANLNFRTLLHTAIYCIYWSTDCSPAVEPQVLDHLLDQQGVALILRWFVQKLYLYVNESFGTDFDGHISQVVLRQGSTVLYFVQQIHYTNVLHARDHCIKDQPLIKIRIPEYWTCSKKCNYYAKEARKRRPTSHFHFANPMGETAMLLVVFNKETFSTRKALTWNEGILRVFISNTRAIGLIPSNYTPNIYRLQHKPFTQRAQQLMNVLWLLRHWAWLHRGYWRYRNLIEFDWLLVS